MFCIKCGQKLPDDAKFCSMCGTKTVVLRESVACKDEIINADFTPPKTDVLFKESGIYENADLNSFQPKKPENHMRQQNNATNETLLSPYSMQKNRSGNSGIVTLIVVSLLIGLIVCIGIFIKADRGIVLTQENKNIVDVIYDNRQIWEKKPNGSLCQYCYFQQMQGALYFECAFNDSASKKYRVGKFGMVEDDYLKQNNVIISGRLLTPSMPDYDYYASDKEKYTYIENLVKEMQDPQKWREMNSK